MFKLQLGHPKIRVNTVEEYDNVREVFSSMFRRYEESTFIYWNNIPIRIRYRQDLAQNFDDILAMLWMLQKQNDGEASITFKNSILSAHLELRWCDDSLEIDGYFKELSDGHKAFCDCLNSKSKLKISRKSFLKEWHTLLHQIVTSLEKGNVRIVDGTERRKLEMLQSVNQKINGFGSLYQRQSNR